MFIEVLILTVPSAAREYFGFWNRVTSSITAPSCRGGEEAGEINLRLGNAAVEYAQLPPSLPPSLLPWV